MLFTEVSMNDTAKKVIAALSVAVIVLTILLGGAIAASVIVVSLGRSDGTAWFYVDGTLYRAVKVENGSCFARAQRRYCVVLRRRHALSCR